VLLDILHKFHVQMHQLMPNANVQISKFIWAVASCRGCPNAEVFAHHYELHYQDKKIHLEGSETTLTAQFGCISFHPSQFGNRVRHTPATQNKWTSGWDSNWFYYKVPLEQRSEFQGQSTHPLNSKMTPLVYEMDVPSSCCLEEAYFVAFIEATSLIGDRDAVEEFLTSGLWPLGQQFGFEVETKESPLSKVIVPMPQIMTTIEQWESEAKFVERIENATNELVGQYDIAEHNAYQGLRYGRLNRIFELAGILYPPFLRFSIHPS
jgi:hypothetical protein